MASLCRNWVGFFVLGAINNLPYVIVNSAASTLADSFQEPNDVGLIFGANVALSVVVKLLNTFVLLKTPFGVRYAVNGSLMLMGLFGVAYANSFGFALACIVISGSSAAFGENVTLGFLSLFPSKLVNAWASGTGMAGLLGSGIYIIFGCTIADSGTNKTTTLHHLTRYAFLLTTPAVLLYWIAYFCLIKRAPPESDRSRHHSIASVQSGFTDERTSPSQALLDEPETSILPTSSRSRPEDPNSIFDKVDSSRSSQQDHETKTQKYWRCFKMVFWLSINLSAVYMFEYVARACAAKVRPTSEYNIGCPELYAALQFCYQAGVFASRSSVQLIQIKRVEILSILQLVNMVVWLFDVQYKFAPVYILPAYMVFVGLLGGASYVNIFYIILNDNRFPAEDREICVNIAGLFITIGISLGSAFETIIFNTALKGD